jgi:hypothetical protein
MVASQIVALFNTAESRVVQLLVNSRNIEKFSWPLKKYSSKKSAMDEFHFPMPTVIHPCLNILLAKSFFGLPLLCHLTAGILTRLWPIPGQLRASAVGVPSSTPLAKGAIPRAPWGVVGMWQEWRWPIIRRELQQLWTGVEGQLRQRMSGEETHDSS